MLALAALHALSPEFNPWWNQVSEYALGQHQWALTVMFAAYAVSCIALFFAVRSSLQTIGGKVGLAFLLTSSVGLVMGGLFDVENPLHGIAFLVGVPSSAVAAILISVSLLRSQRVSRERRLLLWVAQLLWITPMLMFANVAPVMANGATLLPGMWFGWMDRLYFLALGVWVIGTASMTTHGRKITFKVKDQVAPAHRQAGAKLVHLVASYGSPRCSRRLGQSRFFNN